jgi:hypothetical protein
MSEHLSEIHVKRTLQTGQLHEKINTQAYPKQLICFFDDGPSTQLWLSPEAKRHLLQQLSSWCANSGMAWTLCSGGPERPWGPKLWEAWRQQCSPRDGVILVISDLHGPHPSGLIWKRWLEQHPIAIVQLCHDDIQELSGFHDVQQPRDAQTYAFASLEQFERRKWTWLQQWMQWSQSNAVIRQLCSEKTPEALMASIEYALCGRKTSNLTV